MTLIHVAGSTLAEQVARDGWAVTAPCVPQLALDRLTEELAPLADDTDNRGRVRNLFERSPASRTLATSRAVRDVAEAVLGPHCFAVRAVLFDRSPSPHRPVRWHQNLTVAVRARARADGFGTWSDKAGVPNVEAPEELLERMLAVRVHLDACGPDDGPVLVLPGSHRVGRLSGAAIDAWRGGAEPVACLAERGAIVALRPLLLHSSSPAKDLTRRRVVHFDFAVDPLPAPLAWDVEVA